MNCIICKEPTISGMFTPQKRVICVKCKKEEEKRTEELIRKESKAI